MAKIKLPPKLPFKKIGLAGLGLIGGSLAKALIPFGGLELYIFDRDPDTVAAARQVRRFAAVTDQAETFLSWPLDLAYLCLPVRRNIELIDLMGRRGAPYPVTDAGSTKAPIAAAAGRAGLVFCGGHPIAGRELSGWANSSADLLRGCLFLLTPPEEAGPEVRVLAEKLRALHELLDCRVRIVSPAVHDQIYGLVSHLPYLTAAALTGAIMRKGGPEALAWAGAGFSDSTRVSAAAPPKWVEIILQNADNLVENIQTVKNLLEELSESLVQRDEKRLLALLSPIAAFRGRFKLEK